MLPSEAQPPTKNPHPGRCCVVLDSQGVLLPVGSGLIPNGRHRATQGPHVLIQSLPMREALGIATSTNKKEVGASSHGSGLSQSSH